MLPSVVCDSKAADAFACSYHESVLPSFGDAKKQNNSFTVIFVTIAKLARSECGPTLTLKRRSSWFLYIFLSGHSKTHLAAADTHHFHSIKIVHQSTEVHDFTLSPHLLAPRGQR